MERLCQALCATLAGEPADWSSLTTADWSALPAMAQADGVLPLLAWRLEAQGWPAEMPPDLKAAIRLGSYSAIAHSALIHGELRRVLAALAPLTRVVVLKGAALGPTIYPAATLRPLSDIDLLVPEHDLAAATAALQALGYAEMPELTPGINRVVEYHSRLQGGPGGSVTVELHWRLIAGAADWRSPSHEWLWQQVEPWQPELWGAHQPVWQLTPEAQLLYLAAHLVLQHGSGQARLIWLYDLHLLLTRHGDRLRWPEVIQQARRFRWSAALHTALHAASRFFGTPLPPEVRPALYTADDPSAAFVHLKASARPTATIGEWLKLQSLEPRARIRFIGSLFCPSPAYVRWRYQPRPAALWPLWYLFHWLRMMLAGLHVARHLLRQQRKPIQK